MLKEFGSDNKIIAHALNMWANYIETHDVLLSAQDALESKQKVRLQYLDADQVQFVLRLRKLSRGYQHRI